MRIIIIGNSCSGKSTLAKTISQVKNIPNHDLDQYFWKDKQYQKVNKETYILKKIQTITSTTSWIIEGVYTHLLQDALQHADVLIWLDITKEQCLQALHKREGTPSDFQILRMEQYYSRKSGSSFDSHLRVFENFPNKKIRQTHLDFDNLDFIF